MTHIDLLSKAECQNPDRADALRRDYLHAFIDTGLDYYQQHIEPLHKTTEGYCYQGYLWNCFNGASAITFEEVARHKITDRVFAMWDITPHNRTYIKGEGLFHKRDVIQLDFALLLRSLEFLPEDLYIFDEGFRWTLALTHEVVNQRRYCLKMGRYIQSLVVLPREGEKNTGLPLNDR